MSIVTGPLTRGLAAYSRLLETKPLLTKGVTAGLVAGAGDVNCQMILRSRAPADKKQPLDLLRSARFTFLGFALIAPVSHYWYATMMRTFPGSGIQQTVKRVVVDQLFFAPIFIPSFFMSLKTLEGVPPAPAFKELSEVFVDVYTTNLFLWVPAMGFNFGFVAPKFQVLFSNCVGLVWNTYLSFKQDKNNR